MSPGILAPCKRPNHDRPLKTHSKGVAAGGCPLTFTRTKPVESASFHLYVTHFEGRYFGGI